jgi:S1-C subfamily serine protease
LFAGLAATAVVAGVGGGGIGYAFGHAVTSGTTAASSGTQRQTANSDGNGSGIQPIPGFGWSGGDQPLPSDPFADGGSSSSTDTTTTASGDELTGLVRVVSTMKYAGATGVGTGMVLTSDGEVVTNHHVVEGATSIKVKVMTTGKTYVATVVGTDAKDDVAVLQLADASGLDTVTPDDDGGAAVGDRVTAVGDAGGTVDELSASSGEVLSLRQSITTQSEGAAAGQRLTGLIQISSDVRSGDSGGATYDSEGEVVGMTTAASSGSQDIVGYAVPFSTVLRVVDDIDNGVAGGSYDYSRPAFLGVGLGDTGTTVAGVYEGTPAARAGLEAGDRITALGSTRVAGTEQLQAAVARYSPGDRVSVSWTSADGSTHTKTVTLATGAVE